MKKLSLSAASAAMLVTSVSGLMATPASAQWYDPYYYRRDRGISIGDVLTGVLIIGTVATIAGQINKKDRRDDREDDRRERTWGDGDYRDTRADDRRYDDRRYDDRRGGDRASYGTGDMTRAAELCLERARAPYAEVTNARRIGQGWLMNGTLDNRAQPAISFDCEVSADGRITRYQQYDSIGRP